VRGAGGDIELEAAYAVHHLENWDACCLQALEYLQPRLVGAPWTCPELALLLAFSETEIGQVPRNCLEVDMAVSIWIVDSQVQVRCLRAQPTSIAPINLQLQARVVVSWPIEVRLITVSIL